jgi:CubicO group peptidase (beta-lactamase class C family)
MTRFHAAAALLLLLSPLPCLAQSAPAQASASTTAARPSAEQALAGFDDAIAGMLQAWQVPGVAVAIVRDGEVVLARGYGVRNPDADAPMNADTIFPIASMSKAFTSFGAGLLVDEGRMSFDAPVTTYIPELRAADPAATQGLTLRDMLSHRSGMPRHDAVWYHHDAMTRDDLIARMPALDFSAPMRTRFQYNNIMFILSGLAVDRMTDGSWEEFTERRVFQPLRMDRTTFSPERARRDPNHAAGREVLNGRMVTVPIFRNTAILNPAGGVYSNVDDLANWMLVHLEQGRFQGRQIVQPATLADMHATHMPLGATVRDPERVPIGYGLGWFTDIYRGRQVVQHGGNLPGTSTLVALMPSERLGVTVLVNHGGSELRDALTWAIMDRLLGESGRDWVGEALARKRAGEASDVAGRANRGASRVAGTRPSHALADFSGTYTHPGYGPIAIGQAGAGLTARYNDDSSPIEHFHYDVFDATTTDPVHLLLDARLQFMMDGYGRISGLQTVMEPALGTVTFARQPEARLSDPEYLARLTGTYELGGNRVIVALTGNRLSWTTVGGQPATLIPSLGGEFTHSRRRDARIAFDLGASGPATGIRFIDASGVYAAPRVN